MGGVRIARENGDDLGDIDVLAADPTRRCLIPIEAKCFSLAKTPAELANERNELFGDLQNSTGAVGRHLERSEWLRMHREDVLNDFRIDATQWESWSVKPIVVTDADLLSPRLVQSQLPVVTLTNLIDSLVRV